MELSSGLLSVLTSVAKEAGRAEAKHGANYVGHHSLCHEERLAILVEEIGEVAKATTYDHGDLRALKEELVQVAHVAAAWAATIDLEYDHCPQDEDLI